MGGSDGRWDRADRLFDAALDVPPDERDALLDRECAGDPELRSLVARLLAAADSSGTWMPPGGGTPTGAVASGAEPLEEPDFSGVTVDRYRLVREIGRGGMAVVYLAERADGAFDQQLALKLIKRGVDTDEVVRRFERERRILARIRHPNIARFIDGGTSADGRPFFAMELVEGQPIDRYCNAKELPVRQRLGLFLQAARAVAHAHQNLVVHRDIKPSNVLVGEDGQVKLLDFGIARLLQPDDTDPALTRTRDRLLTPAFASPEQIRGEPVTTRSDLYQLGVLLYLLLTDELPYRGAHGSLDSLARAIVDDPPTTPSAAVRTGSAAGLEAVSRNRRTSPAGLRRELSGDLDTIILMALRKHPERRYGSVELLIEDIERHLEGLPVAARPDTFSYRAGKFVRRHTAAVTFTAALALLLVGFSATMALQARRIALERDRANREAVTAQRVSEFLVDLFKVADPREARGETITAREVLDTGAERVGRELADQPMVRAKLMDTIGRVYQNLGLWERAQPLLEQALELRRQQGAGTIEVAESLDHVAWLLENRGDYDAAEPLYREALAIARARHGDEHPRVAGAMNDLGLLLYRKGDLDAAEALLRQALEQRRRLLDPGDPRIADSLSNLSLIAGQRGDHETAETLGLEALGIRREAYGEVHPDVAISLDNLGRTKHARGDHQAAERSFTEALAMRRRLFGGEHPQVAQSLNNLASVRFARGDLEGAEAMFREIVEVDRKLLGPRHPDYAQSLNNLAFVTGMRGEHGRALPLYEESLAILGEALPAEHWLVGLTHGNYGECLLRLGRLGEAEAELLVAWKALRDALGDDHARTAKVAGVLAELYEALGRTGEAARWRPVTASAPPAS